jgi:hypothetical protein
MQVDPKTGQILMPEVVLPKGPPPIEVKGSPITAAAADVEAKTTEQVGALNALGGKLGGRRRRYWAGRGGADVEVKNIPSVPSAGGVDVKGIFAQTQALAAQAMEQGKYDSLIDQPARGVGGKRTRTYKNGQRRSHHNRRKHRGASRKSASLRRTRRGVHTRRR